MAMRPISYNIATLVGMLLFVLLATSSFASNATLQDDEARHQPPTKRAFIMTSSEEQLPQDDVRVYILSFLLEQKDLLRMGAVSKDWRQAAAKVWEKRWLDLSEKPLADKDYKALAGGIFPHLKLNNTKFDDKGALILATASHLQTFELRHNNLCATESLIKLLSLLHLSQICLGDNRIGDEGMKEIAGILSQNTTLTMVDLRSNNIRAVGAKIITEALTQNTTLTKVYLHNNSIGNEGAKAIAGALSRNTALTTVNLSLNSIGAKGAKAIAEALSQNSTLTTLYLRSCSISNDGKKALNDLKRSRPSLKLEY